MHGGISSAIQSPKHKTKCRINSPSDVCRAGIKNIITVGIKWDRAYTCFSVLFKTISDLRKNFARSSGIRLRALLNKRAQARKLILKLKYKGKL